MFLVFGGTNTAGSANVTRLPCPLAAACSGVLRTAGAAGGLCLGGLGGLDGALWFSRNHLQ